MDVYERREAAVYRNSRPDEGPQPVGVWDTDPKNLQDRDGKARSAKFLPTLIIQLIKKYLNVYFGLYLVCEHSMM